MKPTLDDTQTPPTALRRFITNPPSWVLFVALLIALAVTYPTAEAGLKTGWYLFLALGAGAAGVAMILDLRAPTGRLDSFEDA